ncbi:hypothetical protein KFL_003980140 [Klebsormidium nitens]|uniref:Cupin type-1 domain-containing protein n=1 Tax=Klebsormidium nitens TaxID=105231 RepID=A0A1Y1IF51_KLENI|nr:hypothetical protein KFL_003980140 [Klebsormidium nitens]|eukprot:GAQ88079.1 hypothetical protein KFL_003980140 [Klebsormidium nitens]
MTQLRSARALVGALVALLFAAAAAQQAGPYDPTQTGGSLYADYSPAIKSDAGFVSQLITTTAPPPGQGGYNPASGSYANLLDSHTFTAVQGMGVSTAYFNLKPCGLVPPHYHPRAAEVAIVTSGVVLFIFFDSEGNTHYMNVPQGSQVLLPPSLPHIYQEYANAPATIISAFSEESPGTVVSIPRQLFLFIIVALSRTAVVSSWLKRLPGARAVRLPRGIVRSAMGLFNPGATASLNGSIPAGFTTVSPDACTSTGAGHLR